jgi:hypothetical protein
MKWEERVRVRVVRRFGVIVVGRRKWTALGHVARPT